MKTTSIHDRPAIEASLVIALQFYQTVIPKALHAARKAYARHMGFNSKYKPHQGKQECARRVRQMKGVV